MICAGRVFIYDESAVLIAYLMENEDLSYGEAYLETTKVRLHVRALPPCRPIYPYIYIYIYILFFSFWWLFYNIDSLITTRLFLPAFTHSLKLYCCAFVSQISPTPSYVYELMKWRNEREIEAAKEALYFQCICGSCRYVLLTPFDAKFTSCKCHVSSSEPTLHFPYHMFAFLYQLSTIFLAMH